MNEKEFKDSYDYKIFFLKQCKELKSELKEFLIRKNCSDAAMSSVMMEIISYLYKVNEIPKEKMLDALSNYYDEM